MRSKLIQARNTALCLCFFFISLSTNASPWIDPGDERTRHHVQVLADSGLANIPITTWPLMWSSIKVALDQIASEDMNEEQKWSYNYLTHELAKAMEGTYTRSYSHLSNSYAAFSDFSNDARTESEIGSSIYFTGHSFALKISGSYAHNPLDIEKKRRADGSYLAYLWKDWAFGLGAIDRWWGPGWQSSLILSHNARPTPGLFITRHSKDPFELPVLSWLGPWQFTTFMNQLEKERHIPKAKLWGMRVNFKPIRSLEIGLSRTAIWSGEGRPSNFKTFQNLFLGRDNVGDEGTTAENEPGNQLAGIDFRFSKNIMGLQSSFYGQFIGEDEANGTPSRGIALAGLEFNKLIGSTQHRIVIETQNTTMSFYDDEERSNATYEHPNIYQSGYRFYQRAIGASTDNDTVMSTLKVEHFFDNGQSIGWRVSQIKLNEDGSNRSAPGGSIFSSSNTQLISVTYRKPVSEMLIAEIGLRHYGDKFIALNNEEISSGGYLTLQTHW